MPDVYWMLIGSLGNELRFAMLQIGIGDRLSQLTEGVPRPHPRPARDAAGFIETTCSSPGKLR